MKTNLQLLTLGIHLSLAGASFGKPVITAQPQSGTNVAGTMITTPNGYANFPRLKVFASYHQQEADPTILL